MALKCRSVTKQTICESMCIVWKENSNYDHKFLDILYIVRKFQFAHLIVQYSSGLFMRGFKIHDVVLF